MSKTQKIPVVNSNQILNQIHYNWVIYNTVHKAISCIYFTFIKYVTDSKQTNNRFHTKIKKLYSVTLNFMFLVHYNKWVQLNGQKVNNITRRSKKSSAACVQMNKHKPLVFTQFFYSNFVDFFSDQMPILPKRTDSTIIF